MNILDYRKQKLEPTQVGIINYIQELSEIQGTDIFDWDIEGVFGKELPTSKTEINRIFFSKIREAIVEKPKVELPKEVISELERLQLTFRKNTKDQTLDEITKLSDQIHQLNERMNDLSVKLKLQYEAYFNRKMPLVSAVEEIVGTGHFQYHSTTKEELLFTTSPIVMTYQRGDEKLRLPFGKQIVSLNFNNGEIRFGEFQDNLWVKGYIHPYSHRNENHSLRQTVCWGDHVDVIKNLFGQGKFAPLFNIVWDFLTVFTNEGSVHVQFEKYQTDGQINGIPWYEFIEKKLKLENHGFSIPVQDKEVANG